MNANMLSPNRGVKHPGEIRRAVFRNPNQPAKEGRDHDDNNDDPNNAPKQALVPCRGDALFF